ncbi:MAG: FtsB family cell division protein [Bacillota bacterium]
MAYPLTDAGRSAVIDLRTRRQALRPRRARPRVKVRLGRLLFVGLLIYGVSVFAAQEVRVYQLKAQESRVQGEIRRLQQENQALREQITLMHSDAVIEKVAREQLGLVKDGEIPYFNGVPGDPGRLRKEPGY